MPTLVTAGRRSTRSPKDAGRISAARAYDQYLHETGAVFDRAAANLRHGKGGKQRVVPITDTVDDDEIRAAMTAAVAG